MSDRSNEYFRTWVDHELAKAESKLARDWQALDRKAAAAGWYQSGRRITKAIETVATILSSLSHMVLDRALSGEHPKEQVDHGSKALDDLQKALFARIPAVVRSAVGNPPAQRTADAANELVESIRAEIAVQIKLATIAAETDTSNPSPSADRGPRMVRAPATSKVFSEKRVKSELLNFQLELGRNPSRAEVRTWGASKFGGRVPSRVLEAIRKTSNGVVLKSGPKPNARKSSKTTMIAKP